MDGLRQTRGGTWVAPEPLRKRAALGRPHLHNERKLAALRGGVGVAEELFGEGSELGVGVVEVEGFGQVARAEGISGGGVLGVLGVGEGFE
jgi:hypothetical protein